MEVERRWSDEDPLATNDGCGEWICQHREPRFPSGVKIALSDPTLKLLDEKTSFPNVSKLRQQWLKDAFFYACFNGTYLDVPLPRALSKEYAICSYLDPEWPINPRSFLHLPIVEVGKQLNVLDLLGEKLLSLNTSSQNVPSSQLTKFRSFVGLRDPNKGADRGFRPAMCISKSGTDITGKDSPNVQRVQPPEFSCVNVVVRGSVLTSSTTPGTENVKVESTLNLKGKYIMICCVFVPSIWCLADGRMVYHTALASHELAKRDDFVLVVVPMMRKGFTHSLSAYQHFLSGFSCLAVPFHESRRREYICSALGFEGEIKVLVLDPSQKVLYHGPPNMFLLFGGAERDCVPFTPERVETCLCRDSVLLDRSINELLGLSDTDVLYNIEYLAGGGLKEDACITISELKQKFLGLYVCSDGGSLWRLQEVYEKCRRQKYELEIVVVCFPFHEQLPPKLQEEFIIDALGSLKLLSWWFFPFNNTVCHRLRRMLEVDSYEEGLFIVDPIEKYIDPYGLPIICDFGMDGYPFTRRKLIDKELQRIMGLRLNSLLPWTHVCRKLDSGSIVEIPVVEVLNKNKIVVLYIYEEPIKFFDDKLAAWYKNIKESHSKVEVITASIDIDGWGISDDYFLDMGWLVCPTHPSKSAKLRDDYFHPCSGANETLVAFGEDGHIQSVDAFQLLESQGPPFLGDLRAEIGREFSKAGFDYMQHFHSIYPEKCHV